MTTESAPNIDPVPLKINIADGEGSLVVELIGELDIGTAGSLQDLLSEELDRAAQGTVRFDLSGLGLIDSRGIAVLSSLCARVRAAGGSFSVIAEGWIRSVLEMAGVLEALSLQEGLAGTE